MTRLERFEPCDQAGSSPDKPSGSSSSRPEVLARLEQAVGQIHDSDTFRRYLDVQARFHKYSWGNVALILAQRPEATNVAGYNTWLKLHRYVRKGEKGIRIIVPMRRKEREGEEETDEEQRVFFGTGVVFDISQTEGEPLPEVEVPMLDGDQGADLYDHLEELVRREGVSVKQEGGELVGDSMGAYFPGKREIIVRRASALQMTKTLAHEIAHHFILNDPPATKDENESIAESVAYVVCGHFGLDTGARSFPYVALWSRDTTVLKKVLTVVQRVSALIIDAVEDRSKQESKRDLKE
ncbi:MAG: ArdC-like ssDNA-binding domain-containing protein [Candidatus Marsarchaeota archaeon]|nr:ArdC-like ssDNA-binding domain-containing protein [Candidatus Marsarchaeota archaeon]